MEKKRGDVGLRMRHMAFRIPSVAGKEAVLIVGQQDSKLKVSRDGNKRLTCQWGLMTGGLSSLRYREGLWGACCSWHSWDGASVSLTLQESRGYCSCWGVGGWGRNGAAVTLHQVRQGFLLFIFQCSYTCTLTKHTINNKHTWKCAHHPHTIRSMRLTGVIWSTR